MIIKPSTDLQTDYSSIADLAREEPVYITRKGEGDLVVMGIDLFERMEEMYKLRYKIDAAEQSRLSGAKTYSLEDVEKEFFTMFDVSLDPFFSDSNMHVLRESIQAANEGKLTEHELIED